jgi:quercetin dioxygenase-like cupin family protein
MSGAYGTTTGTDERGSRAMMDRLLVFSIEDEIASLRDEKEWEENDKTSRTLAKDVDFRAMLTVMHTGATLDEQDGDARASVQVCEGEAELQLNGESSQLSAGQLAVIDSGQPWVVRATSDCAVLITLAWPVEKAGV